MGQIRTGQAKVLSSNTKRVVFTGVTTAGMASNDLFKFQSENFIFRIASIISSSELELVVNYNGAKALDTFFPYAVSVDFTTNAGFVLLGPGDVDIRDYWNRNFVILDQLLDGRWFVDNATGDFLPNADNTRKIGSASARVKEVWVGERIAASHVDFQLVAATIARMAYGGDFNRSIALDRIFDLANDGTKSYGQSFRRGLVMVDTSETHVGLVVISGSTVTLVSDPSSVLSTTQGTANKTNVYLNGSGLFTIENKRGAALTYFLVFLGSFGI